MDSALTTVGLPLALAIIMFGLGLDLTVGDFKRVGRAPKACSRPRRAARRRTSSATSSAATSPSTSR
jgi:hypothetical protein